MKDLDKIYKVCVDVYGHDFNFKSRKPKHFLARATFFAAVRKYKKSFQNKSISLETIGEYVCVDHCSVIHSRKLYSTYLKHFQGLSFPYSKENSFEEATEKVIKNLEYLFGFKPIDRILKIRLEQEALRVEVSLLLNGVCKHFEEEYIKTIEVNISEKVIYYKSIIFRIFEVRQGLQSTNRQLKHLFRFTPFCLFIPWQV